MSNKQTAVEFLESAFLNRLADAGIMISKYDLKLFEKAKEMEKRQIMDARQDGHDSTSGCDSCGYKNSLDGSNESFYKETYGK